MQRIMVVAALGHESNFHFTLFWLSVQFNFKIDFILFKFHFNFVLLLFQILITIILRFLI
jgi:hypothetical protein